MRILTVRQPWAWAIIHGGKNVENRSRNIAGDYRGPVAIHAGLQWDDAVTWNSSWETLLDAMKAEGSDPWDAPWQVHRGSIIGVVDIVDVHPGTTTKGPRAGRVLSCFQPGKPFGLCSPWADHDKWHLELANPRPLSEPIPYKGALGLREVPADLLARIEATR